MSLLAPLALALLLVLAGAGVPLAGGGDGRGYRVALALAAGAVVLHLQLTLLGLAGWSWTRVTLLAPLLALAVWGALAARRRRGQAAEKRGLGWGEGVAGAALLVFGALAWKLWIVTPDFVFHWGLKGHRYFLAGGVDYDYLSRPWNWVLHPDYPNLLPELYASTAVVAGRFAEPAMMVWSVLWFAALLLAAREALVRLEVEAPLRQAALAAVALVSATGGIGQLMAGGADWLVAFAMVAALPPLLDARGPRADFQIGLLAALAASAKVEGMVLGVLLVGVHVATRWRAGLRPRARGWAALLLPLAIVAATWLVPVVRHGLFGAYNLGTFELERGRVIAASLLQVMNHFSWHGLPWLLLLLPLAAVARRTRPAAALVALQLAFYLYTYFSARVDAGFLVLTSFSRLLLHLLPALLILAGVALSRTPPGAAKAAV